MNFCGSVVLLMNPSHSCLNRVLSIRSSFLTSTGSIGEVDLSRLLAATSLMQIDDTIMR